MRWFLQMQRSVFQVGSRCRSQVTAPVNGCVGGSRISAHSYLCFLLDNCQVFCMCPESSPGGRGGSRGATQSE